MTERVLHLIADVYYRLFGSASLFQYEKLCLDAWRNTLSERAKIELDSQLAAPIFVQRGAGGAKVCFFLKRNFSREKPSYDYSFFEDKAPDLHVATVVLEASNDKQMKVKIFTHLGRFFSIEFPKRPERYFELHHMTGLHLRVADIKTFVVL